MYVISSGDTGSLAEKSMAAPPTHHCGVPGVPHDPHVNVASAEACGSSDVVVTSLQ